MVNKCTYKKKLAIIFIGLIHFVTTAQEQVMIYSDEFGQGILRSRNNICFVITPYHTVKNIVSDYGIKISGPYGSRGNATIERFYENLDLAILRVNSGEIRCEDWLEVKNFDSMLQTQSSGHLKIREEDGSITPIEVTIVNIGDEYITIKPLNELINIQQGMSGSSLLLNGALAGMLLNVNTDTGEGTVIRMDAISRLTETFFEIPQGTIQNTLAERGKIADRIVSRFICQDKNCIIRNLYIKNGSEEIAKIFFSDTENGQPISTIDFDHWRKNNFQGQAFIPLKPGLDKIYVKFEYNDKTFSEPIVKKITGNPGKYEGKKLEIIDYPKSHKKILAYQGFSVISNQLFIQFESPINTAAVLYSFDDGGFFRENKNANPTNQEGINNIYQLNLPIKASKLKLAFELNDGTQTGSYQYKIGPSEELIKSGYKKILNETINNTIKCYKIIYPKITDDTTSTTGLHKYMQQQQLYKTGLNQKGLPEFMDLEVGCVPDQLKIYMGEGRFLFAVKGIRFGTINNKLNEFIPINIDLDDNLSYNKGYLQAYKIWSKAFPPSTKEVYAQYVYYDDTESPITRVPIEPIN